MFTLIILSLPSLAKPLDIYLIYCKWCLCLYSYICLPTIWPPRCHHPFHLYLPSTYCKLARYQVHCRALIAPLTAIAFSLLSFASFEEHKTSIPIFRTESTCIYAASQNICGQGSYLCIFLQAIYTLMYIVIIRQKQEACLLPNLLPAAAAKSN